jgi:uncharacterized protein involved in exopolysaccharide biosynthesis
MTGSGAVDSGLSVQEPSDSATAGRLFLWLTTLLERRQLLLWIPGSLFVLVVAVLLVLGRTYTSTLSFVPQLPMGNTQGVAGLAASLGVSLPTYDLTQTPDFYGGLVQTDQFLRDVVDGQYKVISGKDTTSGGLVVFYDTDVGDGPLSRELAMVKLKRALAVKSDLKTGLVTVDFKSKDPQLSQQVVQRVLALIDRFNQKTRRIQGSAERAFLEGRTTDALRELRQAEDTVEHFLAENRTYSSSPTLTFMHDRLDRERQLREDAYTQVVAKLDQARVEEVRNTPRITVVEDPSLPARPDRRGLLLKGILAILGGLILAVCVIFGQELFAESRAARPADAARLQTAWSETRDDMDRFITAARRRLRFQRKQS